MSEIKLFRTVGSTVEQLHGSQAALEKNLQNLMEAHLETFLGVRLLATEYTTSNGGRIDTLGIDENNAPVIIEYKRPCMTESIGRAPLPMGRLEP